MKLTVYHSQKAVYVNPTHITMVEDATELEVQVCSLVSLVGGGTILVSESAHVIVSQISTMKGSLQK